MSLTLPSAGATTRFGSAGTGRSGSRKKATVKRKRARKISDNHAEINHVATAAKATIRRIQPAARSVCARITEPHFPGSKSHGQAARKKPPEPVLPAAPGGYNILSLGLVFDPIPSASNT